MRVLKAKGVSFERYDVPGIKLQEDLYVVGDTKVANCNILNIINR